jgi:hypothetical protein
VRGSEFIFKEFCDVAKVVIIHPQGDLAKSGYKPNMKVQNMSIVLI